MNYFTIANNELSQDYFFQWLFLYLNKKENRNENVYNCAKKFIQLLTGLDVEKEYEVICDTQVVIKKVRFDLVLIIIKDNVKNVFIIEDKVNYVINNNFDLYRETFKNNTIMNYHLTSEEKENTKWLCIKTGIIKQNDKDNVKKYGIQLFTNDDLKPLFEEYYKTDNEIFDDFVESKFLNDFRVKKISEWHEYDHKQFIKSFIKKEEFKETRFLVENEYKNRIISFKNTKFVIEFNFTYNNKKNIKARIKCINTDEKFNFLKTNYFKNYSKDEFQGIDRPEKRLKHQMYDEREEHILNYLNELNKFCEYNV